MSIRISGGVTVSWSPVSPTEPSWTIGAFSCTRIVRRRLRNGYGKMSREVFIPRLWEGVCHQTSSHSLGNFPKGGSSAVVWRSGFTIGRDQGRLDITALRCPTINSRTDEAARVKSLLYLLLTIL